MDNLVKSIKVEVEVPNSPMAEPGTYCRFCFSAENLTSISYAPSDFQNRIVDLQDKVADVKLNVDHPSAICGVCLSKLNESHYFQSKCSVYDEADESWQYNERQTTPLQIIKTEEGLESIMVSKHDGFKQEMPSKTNAESSRKDGTNLALALDAKESSNGKSHQFSSTKTWRTGPLMKKLNKLRGIKSKSQKRKFTEQTVHRSMAVDTEGSSNNATPQFSAVKTGRTGPLMQKLNKLRGIKNNSSKRSLSEHTDYRCRICLKFFVDKESMSFHLKTHLDSENVRCLNCSKTFNTVQGLMCHALQSYILTTFSCQHCDVLFKSKEELVTHELYCEQDKSKYRTYEIPKAYQCNHCPKSFDTDHSLQAHMLLHEVKLVCVKCGTDFPSESNLKNHNDRYHSKGTEKIATTVSCQLCQRTFVDASAYRSHHTKFHQSKHDQLSRKLDENKLYQCDHCGKRFWSINTIRYHVLVHRRYRDCDQCSESYRSHKELRDHKLAAHPVHCPFCPKKFFAKKSCRAHASKKHRKVQIKLLAKDGGVTYEWRNLVFKCASCEQDYEYFRELSDHNAKMHPGGKIQIKCSFCERHISVSRIGYLGHVTSNCGRTPKKVKAWH